ncbi:hypothetical protein CLAFUW4_11151, partial [Fulvia fulva]
AFLDYNDEPRYGTFNLVWLAASGVDNTYLSSKA